MAFFSASALSDLIYNSALDSKTSVDLLRFRRSSFDTLVPEIHGTFGDEIEAYIATDGIPPAAAKARQ